MHGLPCSSIAMRQSHPCVFAATVVGAMLLPACALADAFPDTVFFNGFEPCVGVQCFQVHCPEGQTTSVSGTVYAPNGTLPLPNVQVYVPSTAVGTLTDGPDYDRCGVAPLGHPIAAALSDASGNFTVANMPATSNVQLVLLAGKWRRQITIGNVAQCTNTPLAADDTRLPRNHSEGHVPHLAIVTGNADSVECLMRKTGVDDAEFSTSSGSGRIHLFAGAGGGANHFDAVNGGATFADATTLWSSLSALSVYDQVIVGCEGAQHAETKPAPALAAMKDYADAGGRVYLAHWENYWLLANAASWQSIATWNTSLFNPTPDPFTAQVNNAFAQAATLYSWLVNVGASAPPGSLTVYQPRQTAVAIDANVARKWIYLDTTSNDAPSMQYFSFTTPVESALDLQKGRLLFTDMHAASGDTSTTTGAFPSGGCLSSVTMLNAQSKALLYAAFDLQRCVGSTRE
jgi:hypothetical protein